MNGVDSTSIKADLTITFTIVGGGIAGLAAAIALARVGHRVTVLEKGDGKSNRGPGGMRLPPNMSKVLFHWGLKDSLKEVALTSHPLLFSQYHTGQLLGVQLWDDELLRETRGEYMLMTHTGLCQILHDAAIALGIDLRYNANVIDIEAEEGMVQLESGEVLSADIIIGADGENGFCRRLVLGREERVQPSGFILYDMQFSSQTATQDMAPEEKQDLDKVIGGNPVYVAMGNNCSAFGYPIHKGRDLAFHFFFRGEWPLDGTYDDSPSKTAIEELRKLLPSAADPNLYHCAHNGKAATRVAVNIHEDLEDWVHESSRLLLIGQAAHPLPPASIQVAAMAIEDAAVLGKLYSHLTIPEQAQNFLYAFQDLRKQRCAEAFEGEVSMINYISTPDGPEQEARDASMRAKHLAGKNVLEGDGDDDAEDEQWLQIRTIFGYDCEDEADNWWVQWGLLRARANSDGTSRQSTMGAFDWDAMTISVKETRDS